MLITGVQGCPVHASLVLDLCCNGPGCPLNYGNIWLDSDTKLAVVNHGEGKWWITNRMQSFQHKNSRW